MPELEEIFEILKKLNNPLGGPDIVKSGWIQDVSIEGGKTTINIKMPLALRGREDPFLREIEDSISRVRGVKDVVIEKTFQETPGVGATPGTQPEPRPIQGVKHIIAVASGKGGVGKSTVALNLALAFKQMGFKAALMDGDIYGPSIPKMMGLEGALPEIHENMIVPIEKYGIKVLSIGFLIEEDTAVIWRGPLIHKAYDQFFFQTQWGNQDFLILDLPPGTGDAQISATRLARMDGGIVVTTPQDVALSDVKKAITMFRTMEVRVLGVIENMSYFKCPGCGHITRIFGEGGGKRLSLEMGVPLIGEIPIDPGMTEHGDTGVPTIEAEPQGLVAKAMRELAKEIIEKVGQRPSHSK